MDERTNQSINSDQVLEQENDSNIFAPYYKSLATRTRTRQWRELASLRAFFLEQGISIDNLATDAPSWQKVTGNLIRSYVAYLKEQHYVASSITMQLYTIKAYARLARKADYLSQDEYDQIDRIQAPPDTTGEPRRGEKRGKYLELTDEQVQQLLSLPDDTPQGHADRLLLALLLLCGFWPREIAALDRHSINISEGTITFYNYHSEEQQTLHLDPVTLEAATHYLQEPSSHEALFVGNRKDSTHTLRLTDRAINARVRALGKKINLEVLAPQDCHAYWEKSLREKQQNIQLSLFESNYRSEAHHYVSKRPPQRKQRPDIYNRQSFEDLMRQDKVEDSMLAPFVSDSRLVLPWAIEFITQQESLKEKFLAFIHEEKLPEYNLKQSSPSFYEETLDHLTRWMNNELAKYREARNREKHSQDSREK